MATKLGEGLSERSPLETIDEGAREALPAPPGHPRFQYFDSIRAFAAISVLLVHVGIASGGFTPWYKQLFAHLDIGVPFFFLLSGFLLYRPMVASRVIGLPRQAARAYARNRFFRIFPAYWVALTVAAIVPGLYGAFTGNWWVYYGLLQQFPVYTKEGACLGGGQVDCGLPPVWSLSIEVFFYLVLPFFALGMAGIYKLLKGRMWVTVELVVLAVLSVISFYIQRQLPFTDLQQWLFYSPLGRAYWFALGMGLAVISVRIQQRGSEPAGFRWVGSHPGLCWILAGAIYAYTALVVLTPFPSLAAPVIPQTPYLVSYGLFGLVAALALMPAIFGVDRGGFVRRLLAQPVLVWLGLISYGIFLWHYPVLQVFVDIGALGWIPGLQYPTLAILTFAGTVVMAALSFYLIERPLLKWSRSRGRTSG